MVRSFNTRTVMPVNPSVLRPSSFITPSQSIFHTTDEIDVGFSPSTIASSRRV